MARPSYSQGVHAAPRTLTLSILCGAALTAFGAATQKLRMPCTGQIVGITLNVGQRGGTHVTSTVDVKAGNTSLLGALFDVAALTPATPVDKEGSNLSAAAASVAKDAVISVVTAQAGGTSPTWADVTVSIDFVPLGD
jgi:hypothetical protein